MKMIEIKFFRKQKCLRKYSNIGRVGGHKLKTLHYPLNLTLFELSSKVSYRALNETMPMREKGKIKKKSHCFAHPAQGSNNTHPHLYYMEGMGT